MDWSEARNHYPNQWLLIEALDFCPLSAHRKITNLRVIQAFGDNGKVAWAQFDALRSQDIHKDIFILHTEIEIPDIRVIRQPIFT